MSATLGVLLKRLDPKITITVYEVAETLSPEASDGWHNAGTGHAGICELSYTPNQEADGTVNVTKAIDIFQEFESSLQFWSQSVKDGILQDPTSFINPVPHVSFVRTAEQVDYLRARHSGLAQHHFFKSMEFSTDPAQIGQWAPLLTEARDEELVAATKMNGGSDVNFGALSRQLLVWLAQQEGCEVHLGHRVVGLDRNSAGGWHVQAKQNKTGSISTCETNFVFVGAGGEHSTPPKGRPARGQRIRRVPHRRAMARLQRPCHRGSSPSQGLRPSPRRRPHDGRASSRYPHHRR